MVNCNPYPCCQVNLLELVTIFNYIIVFNGLKFSGSYLGCLCTQSTIISQFRASLHYVQVCKLLILTKISQLYVSFVQWNLDININIACFELWRWFNHLQLTPIWSRFKLWLQSKVVCSNNSRLMKNPKKVPE